MILSFPLPSCANLSKDAHTAKQELFISKSKTRSLLEPLMGFTLQERRGDMDLLRVKAVCYTVHVQKETVSATHESQVYCSFSIIEILLNKCKYMNLY